MIDKIIALMESAPPAPPSFFQDKELTLEIDLQWKSHYAHNMYLSALNVTENVERDIEEAKRLRETNIDEDQKLCMKCHQKEIDCACDHIEGC